MLTDNVAVYVVLRDRTLLPVCRKAPVHPGATLLFIIAIMLFVSSIAGGINSMLGSTMNDEWLQLVEYRRDRPYPQSRSCCRFESLDVHGAAILIAVLDKAGDAPIAVSDVVSTSKCSIVDWYAS